MQAITDAMGSLSGFIWGPVMLVLLMGTGLYLSLGLKGMTMTRIGTGFRLLWRGRQADPGAPGEITPFNALSTALGATIGTGNIAGVTTAIFLGGPGAVFWMWVTCLVGMALKYSEALLAVKYREVDELGNHVGGPMYYIKNGLGDNWKWLGAVFAGCATIAAFGIGNTIQANSVAQAARDNLAIPEIATGIILAVLTFVVIIGGIKRVGEVAGKLVPFMAVLYIAGALVIIIANIEQLPAAVALI
ncbi:MAG: alanine:cation symporter family protein, partial [Rhodospirillales bacterium]|nr:alanine:cation symporter family protein [Rhodospirillales bacterium]